MSEEEKKAIEYLNMYASDMENRVYDGDTMCNIEKVLNLIHKQQKEIECLESQLDFIGYKKELHKQKEEIEQLANGIRILGTNPDITTEEIIKEFTEKPITEEYMKEFKSRYIRKAEVLKAIGYEENDEEYDRLKQDDEKLLAILDTMYSEFCRLEDIEDQKVEVAVAFIEEKRDKYWQDKIRDKIKELEECKKEELKNDDEFGTHNMKWAVADYVIDLLKELLKEQL